MVSDNAKQEWIELSLVGDYKGHPSGEFAITPDDLKAICANFNAQKNPIPIDYEHASVFGSRDGTAPAAGWIQSLKIEGDSLMALAEWTDKASAFFANGEYRYCSGVIFFDHVDRKTGAPIGAYMHSAGLTNTPFVDGMKPIGKAAKQLPHGRRSRAMSLDIKAVQKAISLLSSDATAEQIHQIVEAEILKQAAIAGDSGDAPEPEMEQKEMAMPPPEPTPQPAPMAAADAPPAADPKPVDEKPAGPEAVVAMLTDILKMDVAGALAFLESHRAELAKMVAGQEVPAQLPSDGGQAAMAAKHEATEMRALKSVVESMAAKLKTYEARDEAAKVKTAADSVEALVTSGRILPVHRATWLALAQEAPAKFAALSATLGQAIPIGTATPPGSLESAAIVDEELVALHERNFKAAGISARDPKKRRELAVKAALDAQERQAAQATVALKGA